jgi:hypothetical protein
MVKRTSNIKFDFGEGRNIPLSMLIIKNKPASLCYSVVVTNKSKLSQLSAPGGGYAVSIIE